MSESLIIDARVSSYAEAPTRLIATLDIASGLLYISEQKAFNPPPITNPIELVKEKLRAKKTLIITDSADTLAKWDLLYDEKENINEIVRAYHAKTRDNLLVMDPKVQGRFNPESVLQARKLDVKTGAIWELSTDTTNGHICVLLACWGAMRATNNFSFTTQLHQDLDHIEHEPDSDDLDEPFTL